jgi:hypothetical protein
MGSSSAATPHVELRRVPTRSTFSERFLIVYSSVVTLAFAGTIMAACAASSGKPRFDEIDVQRINVVEPDGTLRLVISNKTAFPGSFIHGREIQRPDRNATGRLFLNDEGTEMGGASRFNALRCSIRA